MNFYQKMCEKITEGKMPKLAIAMLSIVYYILGSKGMSETNFIDIMNKLGYTFNKDTFILNDGTTNYSIYDLLNTVVTTIYPIDEVLYPATMENIFWVAHTHKDSTGTLLISDSQYTELEGKL